MPVQQISQNEIAETFCKMLFNSNWVDKGHLPDENRWGIDVLYHKRESGKIMFHFITKDLLEINLEFDMLDLKKEGKRYIDSRIELLVDQSNAAREERQRDHQIIIHNSESVQPIISNPKPVASAIKSAIETGETVH